MIELGQLKAIFTLFCHAIIIFGLPPNSYEGIGADRVINTTSIC